MQIIQSVKLFALLDRVNGLTVYNYDGKVIASPKYSGMKLEFLNKRLISLSIDVIAMVDSGNPKLIRIFEIGSTK